MTAGAAACPEINDTDHSNRIVFIERRKAPERPQARRINGRTYEGWTDEEARKIYRNFYNKYEAIYVLQVMLEKPIEQIIAILEQDKTLKIPTKIIGVTGFVKGIGLKGKVYYYKEGEANATK